MPSRELLDQEQEESGDEQPEKMELEKAEEPISEDFGSYLSQLTKTPLLTTLEEKKLSRQIAQGGVIGMRAKDRMVEANMRLVVTVAKQYAGSGITLEDLIQEGAIGLMTAAERFAPELGYKFSTYAMQWIKQAIGRAVDNKAKTIRLPAHVSESLRKIEKAKVELRGLGVSDPTPDQLHEKTGISARKLESLSHVSSDPVSLDMFVAHPGGGGSGPADTALGDLLEDDKTESPEEAVLRSEIEGEIETILSVLDERERLIMSRRFQVADESLYERGSILVKTATDLGWSKERVRSVEAGALRKLRAKARHQRLKERKQT